MQPLASDDPHAIGPHRLLARLGAGGMGKVYLARTPDGHLCALKVVKEDLAHDSQFRARFAREVRTAQRVRGPFTPAVLDADPDAEAPWMATEYVPGPTLKEAVQENGPFPEESLRVLTLGLAQALSTIHAAGLMHRDLKPSNILLSPRGPQLIDFGIARAVEGTVLTRTGQTFGTPSYTSPEQITGQNVTPSADVFSMAGAVLFAASGSPPFGSGSPISTLNKVMNGEPHLEAAPEGPLRDLLARCFAKDPAQRPGADAIQSELSGLPLPSAEHGWLPSQVNQQINAKAGETHRAEAAEQTTASMGNLQAEGGAAPRPWWRRRAVVVATAATCALILLGGGAFALTALPLGSDDTPDTASDGTDDGGDGGGDEPPEGGTDGEPDGGTESPHLEGWLYALKFSEEGDQLHLFGASTLSTWDWREGEIVDDYTPVPTGADFVPTGYVTSATHEYVEVWEGGSDNRIAVLGIDEDYGMFDMPALSHDGSRLAVLASSDGTEEGDPMVQIWDVAEEEVVSDFEVEGLLVEHQYTSDGSALAAVLSDRDYSEHIAAVVWDPDTGEELHRFDDGEWYDISLSEDGSSMSVAVDRDEAFVVDLDSGQTRALDLPEEHDESLSTVALSPDGSLAYGATMDTAEDGPYVWDTETGELLPTEEAEVDLDLPIGVSPDGEHIATIATTDGVQTVQVLDSDFEIVAEFP